MDARHRALTRSIAGAYHEAARVCLSRHHVSPAQIALIDNDQKTYGELVWESPDGRILAACANEIDATEDGAYCCVIAAVELLRSLFAVRRAETTTGADYYVGPRGAGEQDLENCIRLEVSGVSNGDPSAVKRRLLEKVGQAQQGQSSLPALAGVIGFRAMLVLLQDVVQETP